MTAAKNLGRALRIGSAAWRKAANCPSPTFSAGGVATPADAALMMQLGAQAVFRGFSGIFKSGDPENRARAIVDAVTFYDNPAEVGRNFSEGLGDAMDSLDIRTMPETDKMAGRGW